MEKRCQFWLPKKKRFCANAPVNRSLFCGNHTIRSNGKWVACPIDPSHCVLEENVETHVKRCPLLKQAKELSLQPYYQKGINRGKDDYAPTEQEEEADFTSEMKRNWVYNLTIPQLSDLLCKIQTVHSSFCNDIGYSYKVPEACDKWIKGHIDRKMPYQEKHVLQQASILGNLEDLGILTYPKQQCEHSGFWCNENDIAAVVEFGAGRGYLTQILADCYGIKKVFLVERKSYKLKADRSLRQKENLALERLRIDIEDLNLNVVESLRGIPYLAVGKHLCGPATDLSLRCCLVEHCDQDSGMEQSVRQHLRGIAVATCCHHLCQWKHYTGKRYLMNLGINKEDFHAITWFTSWAVDADHGSDLCDNGFLQSPVSLSDNSEEYDGGAGEVENALRNMKAGDRAALGFMCKDIIDMGRLMWVKECGLEAKLVKYVPSDISPENRLVVAKEKTATIFKPLRMAIFSERMIGQNRQPSMESEAMAYEENCS